MTAIVGLLLLAPAGYVAYAWYDLSQPPGVVPYFEWPPGLKAKCEEWNDADVYIDGMEVYDASTFIDTEAYCRVRYTPETWAYLKKRYEGPGDMASARLMWEGVRTELPDWAPNLDNPHVELLPIEPYGDSEHVRLAYDPSRQMIYISYLAIF